MRWYHHKHHKKHVTETRSSGKIHKFNTREGAFRKIFALPINCVQLGVKETFKDRNPPQTFKDEVKALTCKCSSYWKPTENNFSKQDAAWRLNLCKKLHHVDAVEFHVHISKGCVSFVSSLHHSTVCISLYHMHPKIYMWYKLSPHYMWKKRHFFSCLHPARNCNWYFQTRR